MAAREWFGGFTKSHEPRDSELEALEQQALDAIEALAQRADTQPDKVLVIGAVLRRIGRRAESEGHRIGLRVATLHRGMKG